MRNREKLKDNCSPRGGAGAVRSGASRLQGIVCCGRCGRQMAVQYLGRKSYPMYRCARHTKTGESEYCCSIRAEGVDRWVEKQLLEAMRPMGIEAALGAVEELEKRSSALRQEWENRIEQAEYEATLARRRYEGVDPDNRTTSLAGSTEQPFSTTAGARRALGRGQGRETAQLRAGNSSPRKPAVRKLKATKVSVLFKQPELTQVGAPIIQRFS